MNVLALLQILAAVLIVVLLLFIALWQYDKERLSALRATGKLRKQVSVFDGIKDFGSSRNEMFDTNDKSSSSYRQLVPSVNQASGIEYSYNFWLYMDQTKLANSLGNIDSLDHQVQADGGLLPVDVDAKQLSPVVLFLRGDPSVYTFKRACASHDGKTKTDILVKNPLVKLEHGGDVLNVEFNTIDSPDANKNCESINGTWEQANAHKIGVKGITTTQSSNLDKKWFMVTIVIQETIPALSIGQRFQTQCSIYINCKLKTQQRVQGRTFESSPVRQPSGNLFLNKVIASSAASTKTEYSLSIQEDKELLMADLKYFNYALDESDICALYKKQFVRQAAPSIPVLNDDTAHTISPSFDEPMYEIDS